MTPYSHAKLSSIFVQMPILVITFDGLHRIVVGGVGIENADGLCRDLIKNIEQSSI